MKTAVLCTAYQLLAVLLQLFLPKPLIISFFLKYTGGQLRSLSLKIARHY